MCLRHGVRLFSSLLLLLALLFFASAARAQVNTEVLRKRIKNVGYTVIVEGSFAGDTGNTEGLTAGGGLGGGWAKTPHLVFAYARADYARYADVTSVNKTFAHVRYNYEFEDWLWGEVFAQAQSDEFQRLKLRNLFGAGPRFRALHTVVGAPPENAPKGSGDLDVYFGTAYMLERDVVTAAPGATGPTDASLQIWNRWSNYVTAQWEIDERAILSTTMYVQPAFEDFSNVRLLDETLLSFKVTKILVASIAGTVRYDSAPPTDVKTTDMEIKNALTLTF